ncbi:MAG: ABC transporter permease [Acidobacteria bacterium]|nr:ABC transporter permease [Acidobacteriota bacterium]
MKPRTWFLLPARTVMLLLFAVPMLIVAAYSLLTRGAYGGQGAPWTLANYARLLDPLYLEILLKSFWIAALATALCLLLGFPLALFIARARTRKTLWLALVTLPFWTSFLVRTYAWMFLLRDTGLINTILLGLGLISEPLPLLYNDAAVVLGLVYGYLPFTVLPIYAVLDRIGPELLEAAEDLGATPAQVVRRIVLPLARPGLLAGAVLVFVPCLGAYLTPDLMGGGKSILIGNVIQNQFTNARDWPFGAALSAVLMVIVMGLLLLVRRKTSEHGGLP